MKTIKLNLYKLEELEENTKKEIIKEELNAYKEMENNNFQKNINNILKNIFEGWDLEVQYSLYHKRTSGLSFYSPKSKYIELLYFFNILEKINEENDKIKTSLSKCFYFDNLEELKALKKQINAFNKRNNIDILTKSKISIVCHSMFVHEKSCSPYIFDELYDYHEDIEYRNIIKNIEKIITEWYISTCIKLRDVGYEKLYPTDITIRERLQDNCYFANGNIFEEEAYH